MLLPEFNINLNKKLDQSCLIEFFKNKNPLVIEYYPFLKSENDCKKLVDFIYKNKIEELKEAQNYLLSKEDLLKKIAEQLANIIGTNWEGINKIDITPAICPVCPRFIESNSFLVTYFYNKDAIIRICAHEMSHFIYFKKLKQLLPNENIDTEYPSNDWLLSEIITPLLVNSDKLQKYLNQKDEFYAPSKVDNIGQIQKKIKLEFDKRQDFDVFIIKSKNFIL